MLFPLHRRGLRTWQTPCSNVRFTEGSTLQHSSAARGQPVDSMSLKGWIIKAILTLLLHRCFASSMKNSLLISYFITCFSVLFFPWNPINRRKELCGTARINYSLWVFCSGFLGVPVNIKDPGAADRPDVLDRSHLTDLSGTEPVPPPLHTLILRLATSARQLWTLKVCSGLVDLWYKLLLLRDSWIWEWECPLHCYLCYSKWGKRDFWV